MSVIDRQREVILSVASLSVLYLKLGLNWLHQIQTNHVNANYACLINTQTYHAVEVYFPCKYICTPLDFQ